LSFVIVLPIGRTGAMIPASSSFVRASSSFVRGRIARGSADFGSSD
jgi:hypothetical protein